MANALTRAVFKVEREELAWPAMTPLQSMASILWVPMTFMGLMIAVIVFIFGGFSANFGADYFQFPKEVRDTAAAGQSLANKRVFIETTKVWTDGLQFMGMGFLLAAITMFLASILGNLRLTGGEVQQAAGRKMLSLNPPWTAKFPFLMLFGLIILAGHLALKAVLAFLAHGIYDHSIQEIDGAVAGSAILSNVQTLQTYLTWLEPFKFVGIAVMLVGISLALYTIIRALRFQNDRIQAMAQGAE
ncbi:MAG: hypothetical protein ACE5IZ_06280 [Dehalococcoidia bacterium]